MLPSIVLMAVEFHREIIQWTTYNQIHPPTVLVVTIGQCWISFFCYNINHITNTVNQTFETLWINKNFRFFSSLSKFIFIHDSKKENKSKNFNWFSPHLLHREFFKNFHYSSIGIDLVQIRIECYQISNYCVTECNQLIEKYSAVHGVNDAIITIQSIWISYLCEYKITI